VSKSIPMAQNSKQ